MTQGVSKIFITLHLLFLSSLYSCSVNKQVIKQASKILLQDSAVRQGHIGISIYEPATGKYWYQLNADKYFIPASNTKLFTLYAGMKYLGDSLTAALYTEEPTGINLIGTGDPSFLHPDFTNQPLFDFLKQQQNKKITLFENGAANFKVLGRGWAWDDYSSNYMAERNFFPIYGNLVTFTLNDLKIKASPTYFADKFVQSNNNITSITADRKKESNSFILKQHASNNKTTTITFKTGLDDKLDLIEAKLLSDTLKQEITWGNISLSNRNNIKRIYSQATDSLLKPMMHRSDNFFAEQTLLMVSNEKLGYMSDAEIIDNLLKTDLKDIPQKPKWVDGSGLSRYNLFTPRSFVYLLNKMKTEFDWERIKNILPTGGEGTLNGYYKTDIENIFAKTGTLSNNCALSGYLITSKGKLLIFSILNNNYYSSATPVRNAVEKFLQEIRNKR